MTDELTAILYIGRSSSECGHCHLGADPYAISHDRVLSYSSNPPAPCGARFTSMMSTYYGMDDRLRQMRPDLPIYNPSTEESK